MFYLVDYRSAKSLVEQRRQHSLSRFQQSQRILDSFEMPRTMADAEVIELSFPMGCGIAEIGA